MQIIRTILKLSGGTASVVDEYGKNLQAPEIKVGIAAVLELDLRTGDPESEDNPVLSPYPFGELSGSGAFYIAMDSDYDRETDPKMLRFDGISLTQTEDGKTLFRAPIPNTATPGILDAVDTAESIPINVEFAGYEGDNPAQAVFAWSFPMTVRNRVYLGGNVPEDVAEDPEYLNTAQVKAEIQNQLEKALENIELEPGPQGVGIASITKTATSGNVDTYTITLSNGSSSTFTVTNGATITAITKTATAGLVDTYTVTMSDGSSSTFSVRNGNGIAAITKSASSGNIDTYTISFTDESTFSFNVVNGEKGDPGDDLRIDATGELTELEIYANEPRGFTFAASVIQEDARCTKLYVYVKKSDTYNDWCTPIVIAWYSRDGQDGANAAAVPPLEFKKPENDKNYLYFELEDLPAVTIAAVCVDTAEGEYRLPYNTSLGIEKIIKKNTTTYVYFGSLVPEYETGRIYFAQGLGTPTLHQSWQLQGHEGTEADFLRWLQGKSYRIEVTQDDLDENNVVALEETNCSPLAIIDEEGRQWNIPSGSCAYSGSKVTVDFSEIMAERTLERIPGIWKIVLSGGKGDTGKAASIESVSVDYDRRISVPEVSNLGTANAAKLRFLFPYPSALTDPVLSRLSIDETGRLCLDGKPVCNSGGIFGTEEYTIRSETGMQLTFELDTKTGDGSELVFSIAEGTLPDGITLNGNTLSGIPETEGNSNVKIRAESGSLSMVISVNFIISAPEIPKKIYYGCINDGTTYKVSQITAEMLEGDTVTEADAGAITATLAQTMGGVLFVLVPADSGLAVKKDDGVGGKVPFDEDIGAAGTGANGIDITLNGTAYKAYGEFSLIDAETTIYIEGE